jgi:hypothetical protein
MFFTNHVMKSFFCEKEYFELSLNNEIQMCISFKWFDIWYVYLLYTFLKLWKNFKNELSCFIWVKYEKENTS